MQGMQAGTIHPQFLQPWNPSMSMSMSMTPPRCVVAPATVPVSVMTADGQQVVVQMPAGQMTPPSAPPNNTPSPGTATNDSPVLQTGPPQTPQHQVIPGNGMQQPEFSPIAAQPWEVRWGKPNSKPDLPTYTARLQALRGLQEIECPESFEGFSLLLFENEADANVAAMLQKEFILRSEDGSTLPSMVEGPKLRVPPPPPITIPPRPEDGGDGDKGERTVMPKRKRDESGEASATDPKILAVEREQRAQAQRLVATNVRLDQLDKKITQNSKAITEITTNVNHLVQKQAVESMTQSSRWHDCGLLDKQVKAALRHGQLLKLNKLKQYYVIQPDDDETRYVIS